MSTGKKLETQINNYFKYLQNHDKSFWFYQFPDAARCLGRLPKQPADWLIIHNNNHILLDAKELKKGRKINVKSRLSQLPKMKQLLFTENSKAYFLVHALETDIFYLIDVATIPDNVKSIVLENGYPMLHTALGEIV